MGNTNSALNRDPPKVHRTLCGLRYDNAFGFASHEPRGITTTCFNDVVLEPLATWVLLLVMLPLLAVALKKRRSNAKLSSSTTSRLLHYRASARRGDGSFSGKHAKLRSVLDVVYMLLIVAALLMNILQIVRLALADRGVGLLPFNLAGILIVLVLMHVRTADGVAVSTVCLAFWSLLITFTSVALAGMGKLEGIEDRKGTEYLLSDEMIDVGVQVGLYAVFWVVEALRVLHRLTTARKQALGTARLHEQPGSEALGTTQSGEGKMIGSAPA
ncbi:hypothetical protein PANT_7c00350 [Moesziomyces antarcticus T-34]|uniref:Uncharacterized protein n=1 Tax=Pseudozyma antarctica (strain T-34) TaxID=1151754 RepID=M9LMS3_PSEA3|nr:hypothetical protein PANT_7c00350 [Moesziomyces antarcticus T-34]